MDQSKSIEMKGDILIVDDDLAGLRLLANLLTEHGYEVRSARDGSNALMMVSADPPELILLDIQLPDMDGYQVCEQLKLTPAFRDIPVIFISAKDSVLDKIKGFKVGGVDYINKPYQSEEILARIKAHLSISRLHSELIEVNSKLQKEIYMREQAQLALQASETSLRAQYQGMPIPTTTWRKSGDDLILVDYNQTAALTSRSNLADLLGVCAQEFFQEQQNIVEDMRLCLSEKKSIERELDYTYRSTGEIRSMAVKYAFIHPDLVLVHYEDITDRKQADTQLKKHLDELSALHKISKTIAAKRELTKALEVTCETINDLFETRLTFIAHQLDDASGLKGLIGFDRSSGLILPDNTESMLVALSLLKLLHGEGNSRIITDLQALSLPEPVRQYAQANNLVISLIVPLVTGGATLGYLILAKDKSGSTFDKDEIDLAETIATDITARIENERLTELARLAAIDAERQRLARDLHDSVTQSIYSLTLLSSGWESMSRQGTLGDPADAFHRLGTVGQQALREMRLLLHQLRPPILEKVGLVNSIKQRLDTVERRANIETQLIVKGDFEDLPQKIEDELFNIAQEALNNSLRHAMAESVIVRIEEDHGKITLSVKDDGTGFNTSSKHAGIGLEIMQERANAIGGELTIRSEAERGSCVTISVDMIKETPNK